MTITFLRTIILYLLVIIALRAMGKRQIGELSPAELVITLLFSELATIPMENPGTPLIYGIMPILTLLLLEILISSVFLKNRWIRKLTVGRISILISNGEINQKEMYRLRLTLDELLEELRIKGFLDISNVKYAILEASGELSVFPFGYEDTPTRADVGKHDDNMIFPYTIISDGVFIKKAAKLIGFTEKQAKKELSKQGITSYNDVFLMQVDDNKKTLIIPKEKKQ